MELNDKLKLMACSFVFLLLPHYVFADYSGPEISLSEKWGNGDNEIGIRHQDTADTFAKTVKVNILGNIAVMDLENNRVKIYSENGYLLSIIIPKNIKVKYTWPSFIGFDSQNNIYTSNYDKKLQKYSIKGELLWEKEVIVGRIAVQPDDTIIIWGYRSQMEGKEKFVQYFLTGQFLETHKEKPLELGKVKERRSGSKRYKVTIKYPDKEWVVISKGACSRYVRDLNCNLYCPGHRQVIKYDEDGNEVARLTMPKRIADEIPGVGPGAEAEIDVKEEYGPPVVSPNGDVYAWKRTPDTYSIVKWTWQGPPDAPQSLKVISSKTGFNLIWKPPLEEAKTVKEYEIVRSDEICGSFTPISTVPKNILKYEDKDVSEGTNYSYKVSAVRASGSSEYSNKAAGKISVSQTTSMEATGNAYSKVEKDILADKSINTAKLHSFNKTELKLLRNTIFAKYGRSFKSYMLKTWFAKKGWYKVDPNYSDIVLTDTDKKNITTFLNFEKKK